MSKLPKIFIVLAYIFLTVSFLGAFFSVTFAAEVPVSTKLSDLIYYSKHKLSAKSVALKRSIIAPQIAGHIQSVPIDLGSQVRQGDTLAILDCTLHTQNLAIARARKKRIEKLLDLQKKQLKRQLNLLKTNSISQTVVDQSQTDVAVSKASLQEQLVRIKSSSYTVSLCHIKAPFDGFIVQKQAEVGQSASPSMPLFTLLDPLKSHIQAKIPQYLLSSYQQSQKVYFINNHQSYALEKQFLIPEFSENRTIEVRLLPKETVTVGIHGTLQWQGVNPYLPAKYLKSYQDQWGVYVVEKDRVRFHLIKDAKEGRDSPINLPLTTPIIVNGKPFMLVQ